MVGDGVGNVRGGGNERDVHQRNDTCNENEYNVDKEWSKRICQEMNLQYAVAVHAMLLRAFPKGKERFLQEAQLLYISKYEYGIGYCFQDDVNDRKELSWLAIRVPLSPPLASPDTAKFRIMGQAEYAFLPPPWRHMLKEDPLVWPILLAIVGLSLLRFAVNPEDFFQVDEDKNRYPPHLQVLQKALWLAFGESFFRYVVPWSWYFLWTTHFLEALCIVLPTLARLQDKLRGMRLFPRRGTQWAWFWRTIWLGYPAVALVLELAAIASPTSNRKKKKTQLHGAPQATQRGDMQCHSALKQTTMCG